MQKTASGLGLLGSGAILWFAGFPTHAVPGSVDPAVIHKFGVIYLVTVVVLYCIGAYILRQFPITRESHQANLRRLAGEAAPLVMDDAIAPRG